MYHDYFAHHHSLPGYDGDNLGRLVEAIAPLEAELYLPHSVAQPCINLLPPLTHKNENDLACPVKVNQKA